MKIFCVIPAYNEEKSIVKVITDVKPLVDTVVVVNDGSRDNTKLLVENMGVVHLRHLTNRGQGAALQTGNEYSIKNGADIIVHFDADGQFLASEINDIVKPIQEGNADIVFGSRFLNNKSELPWLKKYFFQPIGLFVNKIIMGVNLSDFQNGFRALSQEAAKKIIVQNDGMAHNSEIQYKAHKFKLRIKEVPVTVIYNDFGQGLFSGRGRGSGGVAIIKDLLLAKFID